MKKIILFLLSMVALMGVDREANAQGCVAVRNMTTCNFSYDTTQITSPWQVSLNYRYFRSFRHFRGKEEETNRVEDGTNVINNDNSILLGVNYSPSNRLSFAVTIPYLFIDRYSLYEHYGNNPPTYPRFHTQAVGLGDMRISGYYAVTQGSRLNLTLGLGVKLPTGNYETKDYFHKLDSEGEDSLVYKVVDQSIQLGDGGFGFIVEYDVAYMFTHNFMAYSTGLYLFNPMNTNGVLRSDNLSSGIAKSNEFSVVDQFLFRAGARYSWKTINFALGARFEGIPSEDLIGESDGFRRPGYIVSIEPAAGVSVGRHNFGVSVPIAVDRARTQNTTDKLLSEIRGTKVNGVAAFADWLLSITYAYRL
jgi:hypothetical protein